MAVGVARVPSRTRAGSPGIRRTSTKVMTLMPKSTGSELQRAEEDKADSGASAVRSAGDPRFSRALRRPPAVTCAPWCRALRPRAISRAGCAERRLGQQVRKTGAMRTKRTMKPCPAVLRERAVRTSGNRRVLRRRPSAGARLAVAEQHRAILGQEEAEGGDPQPAGGLEQHGRCKEVGRRSGQRRREEAGVGGDGPARGRQRRARCARASPASSPRASCRRSRRPSSRASPPAGGSQPDRRPPRSRGSRGRGSRRPRAAPGAAARPASRSRATAPAARR